MQKHLNNALARRTSPFNPIQIAASLFTHRHLLGELIKRDVLLRYRGAFFGVLWIFLSPLIMLCIFAFVFGQILQTRWPQLDSTQPYWLILYSGLIVFNLFSETVARSPSAVRSYPSFVKKIIFPVHILPLVPLGAAMVHVAFNMVILLAALIWTGHLHREVMLFPILLFPTVLLAMGLSWFLAAWGVFLKDMNQIVPMFVQMLLFLSPVFYPVSAVPEVLRPVYRHNPLGSVVEAFRSAAFGQPIDWPVWGGALILGLVAALLGYAFFEHSKGEFADAI
jgi:lipopolysaccharide transport system permease protein